MWPSILVACQSAQPYNSRVLQAWVRLRHKYIRVRKRDQDPKSRAEIARMHPSASTPEGKVHVYSEALREWDIFFHSCAPPRSIHEFDCTLYSYISQLTVSRAETTTAAIEKTIPLLKRQLVWSRALASIMKSSANFTHHTRMSWDWALLLSYGLCLLG